MIRLVLFDIDGTLIRTGGAGMRAFDKAFETEFKSSGVTKGISFAGRTDTGLVRQCFQKLEIAHNAKNRRRFFDAYVFWLDHYLGEFHGQVCSGVHDWIESLGRLPRSPALGLLTGNIRLGAEIKLRHYGLWNHFRSGAFGDDHENRNELAVIARERGSRLVGGSLSGDEILVIGDTPLDIQCARAVKARVLAVATGGHTSEELRVHQPDWVVKELRELSVAEACSQ
ncbi:MAG: HAD family hydrolase [Pedosphaera sp.]|nr:HAD family hydrolase [Pedosphaera sp.]